MKDRLPETVSAIGQPDLESAVAARVLRVRHVRDVHAVPKHIRAVFCGCFRGFFVFPLKPRNDFRFPEKRIWKLKIFGRTHSKTGFRFQFQSRRDQACAFTDLREFPQSSIRRQFPFREVPDQRGSESFSERLTRKNIRGTHCGTHRSSLSFRTQTHARKESHPETENDQKSFFHWRDSIS